MVIATPRLDAATVLDQRSLLTPRVGVLPEERAQSVTEEVGLQRRDPAALARLAVRRDRLLRDLVIHGEDVDHGRVEVQPAHPVPAGLDRVPPSGGSLVVPLVRGRRLQLLGEATQGVRQRGRLHVRELGDRAGVELRQHGIVETLRRGRDLLHHPPRHPGGEELRPDLRQVALEASGGVHEALRGALADPQLGAEVEEEALLIRGVRGSRPTFDVEREAPGAHRGDHAGGLALLVKALLVLHIRERREQRVRLRSRVRRLRDARTQRGRHVRPVGERHLHGPFGRVHPRRTE